jgi:hypothetical protein
MYILYINKYIIYIYIYIYYVYIYINYYYIYRHGKSKLFHIYSARSRRSGPGKKLRRSGLVVMLPPTHLEAWEMRPGAVDAMGGLKLIINGHI